MTGFYLINININSTILWKLKTIYPNDIIIIVVIWYENVQIGLKNVKNLNDLDKNKKTIWIVLFIYMKKSW